MKALLVWCMALLPLAPLTATAQDASRFMEDLLQSRQSSSVSGWQTSVQATGPTAAQPFSSQITELSPQGAVIDWAVLDGHYLYDDQFSVRWREGPGTLVPWATSTTLQLTDEVYGEVAVHRDSVRMAIPFEEGDGRPAALTLGFQGCSDAGICFAPDTHDITLDWSQAVDESPVLDEMLREHALTDTASASWVHDNLWLAMGGFFLLGVGLSLSPCMLPMLPVVSAMILGSARQASRGAQLSSLYVAGMISVYAAMGWLVASIGGAGLQAAMRQPLVVIAFATLMVLAGVFTMGLFQLRAGRFSQWVSGWQDRVPGGSALGAYLMGILATLILSPCVTGPLAGVLLYIATTGDVVKGTLSLASLGLGMGLPLIAVGVFGKRILPRPGAWMDLIKVLMGWVLIAMALWLVSDVVTHGILLLLITPATLLFLAQMLRGLRIGGREAGSRGAMMLAVTVLWGYVALWDDGAITHYTYPEYTAFAEVEAHIEQVPGEVLVKVTADWCVLCERMERAIFQNPEVMEKYDGDIIYYDVTENSDEQKETMKRHHIFGPPALIKYRGGQKIETQFGDLSIEEFAKWVDPGYNQPN